MKVKSLEFLAKKMEVKRMPRKKISRSKVIELHEKGFVDREMAEKLNCSRKSVGQIRRELGLESNWSVSREIVRKLHGEGFSDSKIAEELNCTQPAIQRIRSKELGLKASCPDWRTIDHDKFWKDYQSGMPPNKLAEKYGYASAKNIKYAIGRLYLKKKAEMEGSVKNGRDQEG